MDNKNTDEMATMPYLYRFRPTKSLFEFNELENQEIYFASPQQFNDPLEGFKDISPCADEIFKNEAGWRDKYWKDFYSGITTKLGGWSHEDEYRLLLSIKYSKFNN